MGCLLNLYIPKVINSESVFGVGKTVKFLLSCKTESTAMLKPKIEKINPTYLRNGEISNLGKKSKAYNPNNRNCMLTNR